MHFTERSHTFLIFYSIHSPRLSFYIFHFNPFVCCVVVVSLLLKVMAENKNTSTLSGSGCAAVECYSSFFSPSQWWRRVFWIPMFTIVLLFFHGQFLFFSLKYYSVVPSRFHCHRTFFCLLCRRGQVWNPFVFDNTFVDINGLKFERMKSKWMKECHSWSVYLHLTELTFQYESFISIAIVNARDHYSPNENFSLSLQSSINCCVFRFFLACDISNFGEQVLSRRQLSLGSLCNSKEKVTTN